MPKRPVTKRKIKKIVIPVTCSRGDGSKYFAMDLNNAAGMIPAYEGVRFKSIALKDQKFDPAYGKLIRASKKAPFVVSTYQHMRPEVERAVGSIHKDHRPAVFAGPDNVFISAGQEFAGKLLEEAKPHLLAWKAKNRR